MLCFCAVSSMQFTLDPSLPVDPGRPGPPGIPCKNKNWSHTLFTEHLLERCVFSWWDYWWSNHDTNGPQVPGKATGTSLESEAQPNQLTATPNGDFLLLCWNPADRQRNLKASHIWTLPMEFALLKVFKAALDSFQRESQIFSTLEFLQGNMHSILLAYWYLHQIQGCLVLHLYQVYPVIRRIKLIKYIDKINFK